MERHGGSGLGADNAIRRQQIYHKGTERFRREHEEAASSCVSAGSNKQ